MASTADVVGWFRSDMRDKATPYLWSDDDILRYLTAGQGEFCNRAWGITDASQYVTFTNGEPTAHHASILKIKHAYSTVTGKPIPVMSYTEVPDPFGATASATPRALLTGVEQGKLVMYPPPVSSHQVRLVVLRKPLTNPTNAASTTALELGDDALRAVLYYMRSEAYLKEDSETYDKGSSDKLLDRFYRACDTIKHEHERREYQPGNVIVSEEYWT